MKTRVLIKDGAFFEVVTYCEESAMEFHSNEVCRLSKDPDQVLQDYMRMRAITREMSLTT